MKNIVKLAGITLALCFTFDDSCAREQDVDKVVRVQDGTYPEGEKASKRLFSLVKLCIEQAGEIKNTCPLFIKSREDLEFVLTNKNMFVTVIYIDVQNVALTERDFEEIAAMPSVRHVLFGNCPMDAAARDAYFEMENKNNPELWWKPKR